MRVAATHPRTSHLDFVVTWRPFQLDASLPAVGVDKLEHYKRKFGERAVSVIPAMQATGAKLSPQISFDYGGKIANTITSHTVLEAALAEGGPALQDRVCERLFKHYFEQKGDLGDRAALLRIGVECGMGEAALAALLTEGSAAEAAARAATAKAEVAWRRKFRVSGVPLFVIDGKFSLSGAQDPEAFLELFAQIAED